MTAAVFESAFTAPVAEAPSELDDPFGVVAIAEPVAAAEDDPFATEIVAHDASAERAGFEELLAGARHVVLSLEKALAAARDHERELAQKLQGL